MLLLPAKNHQNFILFMILAEAKNKIHWHKRSTINFLIEI